MYKAVQDGPWKAFYRMAASLEIASLCDKALVLLSVVLCQTFACPTESGVLVSPVAVPLDQGSPLHLLAPLQDPAAELLSGLSLRLHSEAKLSLDKTPGIAHRRALPSPTHPWRALSLLLPSVRSSCGQFNCWLSLLWRGIRRVMRGY